LHHKSINKSLMVMMAFAQITFFSEVGL